MKYSMARTERNRACGGRLCKAPTTDHIRRPGEINTMRIAARIAGVLLLCAYVAAAQAALADPGLFGEYFDGTNLGTLVFTRVDATVDFEWGEGTPDARLGTDTFSVRWTGTVEPAYSEVYTFYTRSDDGVRLWIDGELVINNWTDHGTTVDSYTTAAPLVASQQYAIKMEYYENGGGAVAQLRWSSASQPMAIIDSAYLTAGTGEGENPYNEGDWHRNPANGHYYKRTDVMTWPEARAEAEALGGYLATINDADENVWVSLNLSSGWIGANDIAAEGVWEWVEDGTDFWNGDETGSVVPGMYANWGEGEPNDADNAEDHGEMTSSGAWNDLGEQTRRGIVETDTPQINVSGPYAPWYVIVGGSCTFEVEVRPEGLYNESIEWRKEGEPAVLGTGTTYTIPACQYADEGYYYCIVTDDYTSVETRRVRINVVDSLPAATALGLGLLAAALALGGASVVSTRKRRLK
jgi:hypothetical protein